MAQSQKTSGKKTLKDLASLVGASSAADVPRTEFLGANPLQSLKCGKIGVDDLVEPVLRDCTSGSVPQNHLRIAVPTGRTVSRCCGDSRVSLAFASGRNAWVS